MTKKKGKEQIPRGRSTGDATKTHKTDINWSGLMCLGTLVVGVGVLINWHTSLPHLPINGTSSVVSRSVFNGTLSYRDIAEMREAMILTNTLVDQWPARKAFTTKFLLDNIKHIMAHSQSSRTFITYHDNKPYEGFITETWEDFNVKLNTTIPGVLQWDKKNGADPTKGPYLYYTQDLATMSTQFPHVVGYVQPIQELMLSKENIQVNLWVGREGLVTHTHYDCSYNFFFQLQGKKRFTLFPPDQDMYLYPCLHPHYGHSQVDILNPDYGYFPLFKNSLPVVAEVEPGDMLVVPPFWFHHVETLEESVSVNVWSDAPEYELMNQVYSLPIPFEENWDKKKMIIATKIYIDMFLLLLGIEPRPFLKSLLNQRYKTLIQSGRLKINTAVTEDINVLCIGEYHWERQKEHIEPTLKDRAKSIALILQRITSRSILEICVGNFIEHLVQITLGVELIYPFLNHCTT